MREACPGAILPPRPDKHEARFIEEGLQKQSADFAAARAVELQTYLTLLAQHPHAGKTDTLRLFLTLHDHIGSAWPELSSSVLTRLTVNSTNAAVKVAEGTSMAMQSTMAQHAEEAGEDNAELLAMAMSEHMRLSAVTQSVIKIDGSIHQFREHGENSMLMGLELSRLCNSHLIHSDPALSIPFGTLSTGLMKSGKRSKYLSLQLSAAFAPFVAEYRQSKNERLAFHDRRLALIKRQLAREKAAGKSSKLVTKQMTLHSMKEMGTLERMEMEASMSDEAYMDSVAEAEEVGKVLAGEVNRLAILRRKEWMDSMKVMVSGFKEACSERKSIWEDMRAQLDTTIRRNDGGSNSHIGSGTVAAIPNKTTMQR